MKAYLMFKNKDFNMKEQLPFGHDALVSDLELKTLFSAMAQGDDIIMEAVNKAILCSLQKQEEIKYRQDILRDCIKNPVAVRKLYALTIETINRQKKEFWWQSTRYLSYLFSSSVSMLQMFAGMLKQLRQIADNNIKDFESDGFITMLSMLQHELDDDYFALVNEHLNELKFRNGILISARLGHDNQGIDYVLRRKGKNDGWFKWKFAPSFTIAPRDDNGAKDLSNRRELAINEATNALAQSAEHILSFFLMLRTELAFYVGCLNLYDQLRETGQPVCFPEPLSQAKRHRSAQGLYDVCLALITKKPVVGNDLSVESQSLFIITGANQGGKSTFLRSIGQAQLMMQCGMFTPANAFEAKLCNGVYTHFKKEEDAQMKSGKLDEELARMSLIADRIKNGALILFNESFSATNEREGSEIARQIVSALIQYGIEVFFVTHFFDFANSFYEKHQPDMTFLRAERLEDGTRTFRIILGEPLKTGFGEDLYQKVFSNGAET